MTAAIFIGSGRGFCPQGQHADFGDAGAEFVVLILRDAGAFLFHRVLVFNALTFLDLQLKLTGALLDLAVKLRYPQHRADQQTRQDANAD